MKKYIINIICAIMTIVMSFQIVACSKGDKEPQKDSSSEDISLEDENEDIIKLNETKVELKGIGDTFKLILTKNDVEITNGVKWSSKNPLVVSILDGVVKAESNGSTAVVAIYEGVEYKSMVYVNSDFKIEFTNDEIFKKTYTTGNDSDVYRVIELNPNEKFNLEYKYVKELSSDSDKVNFSSSDESIVTVSNEGEISTLNEGIAVVSVETEQTKVMDVVVGMGSEKKEVSAKDSVLILVGEDKTQENMKEFFKDLHLIDVGYSFYGEYNWKGFEKNLIGEDDDENTVWSKDALVNYKGGLVLELYKDGVFIESGLDRLPRKGYIEDVDESLPELTIGEAKIKYGNAHRYPAEMFSQEGVIKFYGDSLYLIMTENNSEIDVERKIRKLGPKDLTIVENHFPFEFMNDLYSGLNYTMERTIIGYKIDKQEVKLKTAGSTQKLNLVNGDNKISKDVVWSSEDEKIATVDQNGLVKAISSGSTNIIATYKGTKYKSFITVDADYDILITNENIKSVLLKGSENEKDQAKYLFMNVPKGKQTKITYNIKKQNISNGNEVTFSSSDESIATINKDGTLNPLSEGMCVISIKSKDKVDIKTLVGMGEEKIINDHFVKEFILTCGDEGNLDTFLNGKNGYRYFGNYNWKGFEKDISKNPLNETNDLWKEENLKNYTGDISIEINKDGTFKEQLGIVPREGFIKDVDKSLKDTLVEEALLKYGNAYRYNGAMFNSKGVVKIFGDNVYLIYVNSNSTSPLSERVAKISTINGETVKAYSPFEFMTKLYDGLKYDLQREDI